MTYRVFYWQQPKHLVFIYEQRLFECAPRKLHRHSVCLSVFERSQISQRLSVSRWWLESFFLVVVASFKKKKNHYFQLWLAAVVIKSQFYSDKSISRLDSRSINQFNSEPIWIKQWGILLLSYLRHRQGKHRAPSGGTSGTSVWSQWWWC